MHSKQFVALLLLALPLAGCGSSPQLHPSSTLNPISNPTPNPVPTPAPTPTPTSEPLTPITTLTAQTANNSSASSSFANQVNGNLGANNVSKVNIHSLLYAGNATKVLAQYLLWFGQGGHMNVGYNSNDASQVKRQIADMISRGIDGVIVDWYGPNNAIDQATRLVMHEAEKHAGFSFAIMIDAGAVGANQCNGCSPQQVLVNLLQYVEQNYFPSSAYLNVNGQPVVTNFNVDDRYAMDWQAANGKLKVPPRFLFQDNGGFSHAMSDGSYSWVMPWAGNYGLGYLSNFYYTGLGFADKKTMGATYKGFNDKLASWGSNRVIDQQCGQTWLNTFSQVNSIYNQGTQLPYLQLVTWNDYEEGTEIESGIDSCFSLQTSVSGNSLKWSISGDESTVDHYTVFASTDGQNLAKLTDTPTGTSSVDLCSLSLPPDNYELFVQAVGKPSMANRMPGPVGDSGSCSGN